MHNDLYNWLANNAAIKGAVGSRVYHQSMPQANTTFPALAFEMVGRTEIEPDFDRYPAAVLDEVRYQFDIIAKQSADAISAAIVVSNELRSLKGVIGTTNVQWTRLDNENHFEEKEGDKLRRRVVLDYSFIIEAQSE